MLIYQIVHLESGHKYIGQTTRPLIERWREHLYALRKSKHGNRYLQAAWNKYGEKAFKLQIVKEFSSLQELNKAEMELIQNGTDLYNLSPGGEGHTHSEYAKKMIGEANKLPIIGMDVKTREIKEYDSAADTKKGGFNEKCVRKCVTGFISKRKDGTTFTSISHKGWVWMSKEEATMEKLNEKCDIAKRGKIRFERPVTGINIFDQKVRSFRSASEAGRNGFNATVVHAACAGRVLIHMGFVWCYADIDNPQSLLERKRKSYLDNPPKTGPKSWKNTV